MKADPCDQTVKDAPSEVSSCTGIGSSNLARHGPIRCSEVLDLT
jgi:hypothetical protein